MFFKFTDSSLSERSRPAHHELRVQRAGNLRERRGIHVDVKTRDRSIIQLRRHNILGVHVPIRQSVLMREVGIVVRESRAAVGSDLVCI